MFVRHVCCILLGEMRLLKWCVSYTREGEYDIRPSMFYFTFALDCHTSHYFFSWTMLVSQEFVTTLSGPCHLVFYVNIIMSIY